MVFKKSNEFSQKNKLNQASFHVVYLGENGFPIGLGAIQRLILISKALIEEGVKVTVVNRKGKFDPEKVLDLPMEGVFEGINYVYTSDSIYRPAGFFNRNFKKIKGLYSAYQYLKMLRKKGELDAAIVSCYSFFEVLFYQYFAWSLSIPIVYNYVEMAPVLTGRQSFFIKINDALFERFIIPRMDGVLPISDVLIKKYQELSGGDKVLKLPILCEFDKFDIEVEKPERDFFLYCGALAYKEVVDFVLEAYDLLPVDDPVDLHFVLGGGTKEDMEDLTKRIQALKKGNQVKVFHNVDHSEIPGHYKPARALLIPMRPTLQDAARFPHKIGEYVASGNPMISCDYGEVTSYFKDMDTALVAEEYSVTAFAAKMQYVLDHPKEAADIGERGKQLGLQAFNHLSYGAKILAFLKGLKK